MSLRPRKAGEAISYRRKELLPAFVPMNRGQEVRVGISSIFTLPFHSPPINGSASLTIKGGEEKLARTELTITQ